MTKRRELSGQLKSKVALEALRDDGTTQEIVVNLRQVEVLMGQGMLRIDAIRQISVTEQT